MFSMPTMTRPPLVYPGTPAKTPHLRHLCLPAINAAIQEQTGQTHNVLLNPQPHEIDGLVQALGPGLSKIGITVQDCLDGLSKPLKKLCLTRPTVDDGEHSMYNSLVFKRRPLGQKTDGMILCVTTTKEMLNWLEDSVSGAAPGSVNVNGGGGGSHRLQPFIDGSSTRLGIVYSMTPKAKTMPEYQDDVKVRSFLMFRQILTVFMMSQKKTLHYENIVVEYFDNGRKVPKKYRCPPPTTL